MPIKIDANNANIAVFRSVLHHLPPVLAASSGTLNFFAHTGDWWNFPELSRSGVPKSS